MSNAPTVTLRNAGDLVATMPYLLGYQPRDALVVVCLKAGRVCLTACQPLPAGEGQPPALDALLAGMAKADPDTVVILGYENGLVVSRPAAKAGGLPEGTGLHLLRHYYASLLIRYGESVKTVQARLGHATAAETLTPTRTCGPTRTTARGRPSTHSSARTLADLRTLCGLKRAPDGVFAVQARCSGRVGL